ncbi:MAG: hypothetical protein ACKPKO_26880, partial [Candidatus Fonsibacter sp.]
IISQLRNHSSNIFINSAITASSFIRLGGDATQYLMADGSTSSWRTGPLKLYHYMFGNMTGGVISHESQLIFALTSDLPPLQSNTYMTMDALGVTITKSLNLSQDLVINGATSCASDFYAPNIYNKSQTYNKTEINNLLSAKQNTLTHQSVISSYQLVSDYIVTDTITSQAINLSFKATGQFYFKDSSNNIVMSVALKLKLIA